MTETVIEPDGDVSTPWNTPTPHWSKLNDGVTQPTAGDGTAVIADEDDDGEVEEFNMEDGSIDTDLVSQVVIWFYAKAALNGYTVDINIYWDSAWKGNMQQALTTSYAWYSKTFDVSGAANRGQTELSAMKTRITADSAIGNNKTISVDAMYAAVTHEAECEDCCGKSIYAGIGAGIF